MAVEVKRLRRKVIQFKLKGTSPLVTHKWSEKAKEMMREKGKGRKTKDRDARDPEAEAEAATYRTPDGQAGFPLQGFKKCFITAAHRDIGIEKTLVRKSLFIPQVDGGDIIPIDYEDSVVREDMVRVGMGSADIRYRPQFNNWSCHITAEIDAENLTEQDVIVLVERAGFGVGIGENRPEKSGDWGRFELCMDYGITSQEIRND